MMLLLPLVVEGRFSTGISDNIFLVEVLSTQSLPAWLQGLPIVYHWWRCPAGAGFAGQERQRLLPVR